VYAYYLGSSRSSIGDKHSDRCELEEEFEEEKNCSSSGMGVGFRLRVE
jgi:hypothetical protein